MRQRIVQGLLVFFFILGMLAFAFPVHMAHAASAKPRKPMNGPIVGESDKSPSATTCFGSTWYSFKGDYGDNHINIDQFGPPIPGGAIFGDTTPDTPAIACFNNRIYVAWEANDSSHEIHFGWWDGNSNCAGGNQYCTLQGGGFIRGQSTYYAPALAVNNGGLFISWAGTDQHLNIMESVDGYNWYGKTTLTDTTVADPSLTSYLGDLWVAWPATDPGSHLCFGWYHGATTLNNHNCLPNQQDYLQVGLSSYNQRLQFVWKGFPGTNHNIYSESYEPPYSFVPNGTLSNAQTNLGPALTENSCFYVGTDLGLNYHNVY